MARKYAKSVEPQASSPPLDPSADVNLSGSIPQYTHQHLIDALYNAAHGLDLDDWALLEKAGLNLEELAADRNAVYRGTPIEKWSGLSDPERELVLGMLAAEVAKRPVRRGYVLAPAGLNLRSGPGADQALVTTLPDGTRLAILDETGEWLLVAVRDAAAGGADSGDPVRGYVHGAFVAEGDPPPQPDGTGDGLTGAGYFGADGALLGQTMKPAPSQQLRVAPGAGEGAQSLADIWNRTGGLLAELARRLAIDPAAAVAVLAVESGGSGFGPDKRMVIRFENHLFFHHWGRRDPERFANHFTFSPARQWENHTWRPRTDLPFSPFHGSQPLEWDVLTFAQGIDDTAAKSSISMGGPQILGSNHQRIGYPTVQAMFEAFARDERAQILGLFDFIRADGAMVEALRTGDYTAFAGKYNGPGQAEMYGRLIASWVNAFNQLRPAPEGVAALPRPINELILDQELDALLTIRPEPRSPEVFMQVVTPSAVNSVQMNSESPAGVPPAPGQLPLHRVPADADPEVRRIWLEHVEQGFENNAIMFKRTLRAFMIPYYLTVALYVLLFFVGIGLFVLSARLSTERDTLIAGLLFGGLGVATFLTFFIRQPMRALEENLQFITWLGIIYNSYWTRLLYIENTSTVQAELEDATQDAIDQIDRMLLRNAEFAGKRPASDIRDS
jgi:hypothetical protein